MNRLLTIILVSFLSFNYTSAQLADGSIAPDWTLTDVNGTAHNLYSYLDGSYTVFLDFSAVWCGPCWSYHTSGALEDLYTHLHLFFLMPDKPYRFPLNNFFLSL